MRRRYGGSACLVLLLLALDLARVDRFAVAATASAAEEPPAWAFVVSPSVVPAPPMATAPAAADTRPRHVPGSTRTFRPDQIVDRFSAPDWHPDGHAPMPAAVATGRRPEVYACGYCHLPNGQGRPENASLAGLPAAYIVGQVRDFRDGRRRSSEPGHVPTALMVQVAAKVSDEELEVAARYFAGLKRRPWIRVVEADRIARTRVGGFMLVPSGEPGTEPIGTRIVEIPVDVERTELRDDASGFVAYVPTGSLAKGERLVASGGGVTVPCAGCHGDGLHGLGPAPALAGRSPSYLVRQLYDLKRGARHGTGAALMQPTVARLVLTDMIAIAAYAASLPP